MPKTTVDTDPEYYTVGQIAARLGVSKMTIYRQCHSGEIPSLLVGRSFRIPRARFDALLASRTSGGDQ